MNPLLEIAEVSVGKHFYWQLGEYQVHGQVLMVSCFFRCSFGFLVSVI
jgi:F-type H+-transporting ATPase subunit a